MDAKPAKKSGPANREAIYMATLLTGAAILCRGRTARCWLGSVLVTTRGCDPMHDTLEEIGVIRLRCKDDDVSQ